MPILHRGSAFLLLDSIIGSSSFIAGNPNALGRLPCKWRARTLLPPLSLRSSTAIEISDNDLWDADGPLKDEWASSLPLPENAKDPSQAEKAQNAMAGPHPAALEGRCNVNFDGFDGRVKWVHVDPPVLTVEDFLTDKECDAVLELQNVSPPPGAGRVIRVESRLSDSNKERSGATAFRSSTTWYARYAAPAVSPLINRLLELLPNVALNQVEEVQLVRYEGGGQGFGWHEDILTVDEATPDVGGQRIATLLVYLDECENGRTLFRDLRGTKNQRLAVSPVKGRALLFFPSTTGHSTLGADAVITDSPRKTFGEAYFDNTRADHRTSHAGEPPGSKGQKNIAQLWIHSLEHTPRVFGRGLNRHDDARQVVR